jgi:spore coat polysaccharide biosynthesis predicted glycosyltransferase SpsG
MHPSCGKRYYDMATQAASKNHVKTIITKDNFRELLALAQVLIIPISSIGYEAVILKKPLVCVDFDGYGDENLFVNAKVGIGVQKTSEMSEGIRAAIELTATREYELARERFIDYHLDGMDSSRMIADLIAERYHTQKERQG